VYLPPTAQNIASLVLAAVWFVGMIILYFRMRAKQVAYLERFPPVEGVPLHMVISGNPFGAVSRAIWHVTMTRQPDIELEQLRQEMWHRFLYQILWTFGFPLVTIGVAALLIATGIINVIAK
jgi:heme/copper-type cytochrome/quinol oxidase subunit 1